MFAAYGVKLVADKNTKPRSRSRCGKHDILIKRILADSEGSSCCQRRFVVVLGKIEIMTVGMRTLRTA